MDKASKGLMRFTFTVVSISWGLNTNINAILIIMSSIINIKEFDQ